LVFVVARALSNEQQFSICGTLSGNCVGTTIVERAVYTLPNQLSDLFQAIHLTP
jgi:hypothetical protein